MHKIDDRMGPGQIAPTRNVVFRCAWPGKKEVYIGTFEISKDASAEQMAAEAKAEIAKFTSDHFPDGYPPPDVIEIKPGALRWIPDYKDWRRR